MTIADNAASVALKLISKFGSTIAIQRVTAAGSYDPATGIVSSPTTVTDNVKAYVNDVDLRIYGAATNLLIKTGDKVFLISASGLTAPSLGDKIVYAGDTYSIVPVHDGGLAVQIVNAQDTNIIYKVHGRKT